MKMKVWPLMICSLDQTARAWMVVLISLLLQTISAGLVWSYNTLIIEIGNTFPASNTVLIWLGALPTSLPMIAAPLALAVNIRLGTWKTVLIGTVVVTIGVGTSAVANSLPLLYFTYGAVVSAGLAFLLNAPYFFIGELFPYDHPRHVSATSIGICGFPLATLIFNPVAYAFEQTVGWRYFYVLVASLVLGVGLLLVAVVRNYTAGRPIPDHTDTVCMLPSASVPVSEGSCELSSTKRVVLSLMWLAVSLAKCLAYYTPMLTLISQMATMGIGAEASLQVMPILGATELASRLAASYVGNYVKGYMLIIYAVCCVFLAVINLLALMATTYIHMMFYGVGLGLFFGPIVASMYSSGNEVLYGEDVQMLYCIFRTGSGIACLMGPLIAGVVVDRVGNFRPMMILYAGLFFLSAFIYGLITIITRSTSGRCFEGSCWNRGGHVPFNKQIVSYRSVVNEKERALEEMAETEIIEESESEIN